jgi:hypothetical protein
VASAADALDGVTGVGAAVAIRTIPRSTPRNPLISTGAFSGRSAVAKRKNLPPRSIRSVTCG